MVIMLIARIYRFHLYHFDTLVAHMPTRKAFNNGQFSKVEGSRCLLKMVGIKEQTDTASCSLHCLTLVLKRQTDKHYADVQPQVNVLANTFGLSSHCYENNV